MNLWGHSIIVIMCIRCKRTKMAGRIQDGILLGMLISLLSVACSPTGSSPGGEDLQGELTIFHAGSLSVPVERLTEAFQEDHPVVRFRTEAAGSRTTARKVSELGRRADVVMSADYEVIDTLLVPEHAAWNVGFARNTMVIAYTDRSHYNAEINGENWYQILLREDVEFGHSDPHADPNGYRTLMVWHLAEKYYQEPGLYLKLDRASPPENIRPKETDLIALLQTGNLDYAFSYLSVAMQHDLRYVHLPDEINLGVVDHAEYYRLAEVALSGKEPGTTIKRQASPILYGLTIPTDAPNPDLAVEFLTFLFGPEGQKILKEAGQPPLHPPCSADTSDLPDALRPFVETWGNR